MRGIGLPSGSTLFYLVLLIGLIYGLVWFSNTRYAAFLRDAGVPVPYCTTHPLVSMCEMDYTVPSDQLVSDANTLDVFLFARPSSKLMNAFCSLSENGSNVRMVLSTLLKDDKDLLKTLDQCKIKYRFSPYVTTNELSTGRCYLDFTGGYGVYTCCAPVVKKFDSHFQEVWDHASP